MSPTLNKLPTQQLPQQQTNVSVKKKNALFDDN